MSQPSRGNPVVTEGLREPLQLGDVQPTGPNRMPTLPEMAADGRTVYMSSASRYRVQLTAPKGFSTMDGVKHDGGRMLVAQFEDNRYTNHGVDAAERALIDQLMQRNKYFGKPGGHSHFWLASEQARIIEIQKKEQVRKTLAAMPQEELAAFVAELKAGEKLDHELPPVGKSQRSTAGR
jgi:hypothetical protein